MELHAKLVRSQLNFFKPLAENCSLELTRKGQDKLGELMTAMHRRETFSREHDFRNFQGAWIMPKDERRTGVILYPGLLILLPVLQVWLLKSLTVDLWKMSSYPI